MQLWDRVLSIVEKRVSRQNFDMWFRPTALLSQGERDLCVQVPNSHFQCWLAENYGDLIDQALKEVGLGGFNVKFSVAEGDGAPSGSPPTSGKSHSRPRQEVGRKFNGKYTFDTFVVGFCNQLAHAASLAVSDQPARAYNPLFLYGGVGMGKTHLLHAIGHRIQSLYPEVRLSYMSSERFMNELIQSIRFDNMIQFREKYRNIDVLLMDDIQFMAGKERTQEEFFHTFNELYDSQKQIIISSDSAPKEIPTLEERLHSRFEWGLIADLQPPDLETKIAILKKKAEAQQVSLEDEVVHFIAGNIKSNVRELEGALVRLVAYSSLTGEEISLALAQRVLRNILENQNRVISIDCIQKSVASHYSVKVADLKAKNNSRRVAEPRQVAMFLSKELTENSLAEIGKEFGGKHHTTVLHAIRKVRKLRSEDRKVQLMLDRLIASIQ